MTGCFSFLQKYWPEVRGDCVLSVWSPRKHVGAQDLHELTLTGLHSWCEKLLIWALGVLKMQETEMAKWRGTSKAELGKLAPSTVLGERLGCKAEAGMCSWFP